ncbi:MAG: DUF1697 domain-containing protein [Vicinamibacterales bacterium]
MARYVALLRAINVGGHVVAMEALRAHFTALGFDDVETFIASGNVLFSTGSTATASLTRRIEARLRDELEYDVATFLRTGQEMAAVARHEPFSAAKVGAASALNVAFFAAPLDRRGRSLVSDLRTDIDDFHVHGRELYWLCRKNQSDSKFSNAALEKALGLRSTFRGINTVRRLAALMR